MSVKNCATTPSERLASVDDMLLYRLGQLSATAGAMVVRLCEGGFGITRREWGVLAQLHGQPQGLLPSALAERMRRDRARTSRTLTALLGKGLIERVVLPHDRRSARVSLTPAGQALYDALMPQVQAINARILAVLDPAQKQSLDEAIDGLRAQAQRLLDETGADLPKADRRRGVRARPLSAPDA
ncbi:MAG: MarR family winged helix-turn-helix transcriptional regulator [Limnohabitans sp.]